MIDLAISIDDDPRGVTIVETNHGDRLAAPKWPQDSDFRLVAFSPRAKECDVIAPRELARDIASHSGVTRCVDGAVRGLGGLSERQRQTSNGQMSRPTESSAQLDREIHKTMFAATLGQVAKITATPLQCQLDFVKVWRHI